jgi:hypothetical protein
MTSPKGIDTTTPRWFDFPMTTLITDGIVPDQAIRDANGSRFDDRKHIGQCRMCRTGLTSPSVWLVELTTRGRLIHADERFNRTDSQGAFPVGPECARKIPRAFKIKASEIVS